MDDRTGAGTRAKGRLSRAVVLLLCLMSLLLGVGMVILGAWLLSVGGSAYYLVAGLLLAGGSVALMSKRERAGFSLQGAALLITLAWSLWEIGGKGWMPSWGFDLAGRAALLATLFGVTLVAWALDSRRSRGTRRAAVGGTAAVTILLIGGVALTWERPESHGVGEQVASAGQEVEWSAFGGDNAGERHAAATQITPSNVSRLQEAWRFSTGDTAPNDRVFFSSQNTPLKIGDTLFTCSPSNKVFALDPATGAEKWRFDPKSPASAMESVFSVACRSVGYHESPEAASAGPCATRVFVATIDGRLIGLDAATGQTCGAFGNDGVVDLTLGMDMGQPGFASNNSGPTVAGGVVMVGQQVSDNQTRDAPSGVVRAYDAMNGELRWAWDAKRIDRPGEPLAEGASWPRGTPNVWNVISADQELGLAFLATGNAAADHFGGGREPEDDAYSAAVVAVELNTGVTRWSYRTVERDRWDYDLGAQPVVTNLSIEGEQRRVIVQGTKTGSIFVLDALTGAPLRPVEQRPVPQGGLPGETLSLTQPQSVFYPNFSGQPGPEPERIDARHTFGLTPLDGAYCRIQFHRMRYEGIYTPPTEAGLGMLLFPGTIGGLNWGGLSIDPARQIMITNHSRLPNRVTMIPRAEVDETPIGQGGARPDQEVAPHAGTPWGVDRPIWVSPLNVPCIAPPWGYLAATDMQSGKLLWSRPLGTGYDMGPLNVPSFMRIQIGTPNIGGAVTTASGLTFIAAAQDDYFRAFETTTGRLLWTARLPAGGQASPMSYTHKGRQYVAITATGHSRLETRTGDSLVVYTLDSANLSQAR